MDICQFEKIICAFFFTGVSRTKSRWGRNFAQAFGQGDRDKNMRFEFNIFENEILSCLLF